MSYLDTLATRLRPRRPRLLPVLVAAITLAAGMKVGTVWTDATLMLGVQRADAQAQTGRAQPGPAPAGNGAPRPLLPKDAEAPRPPMPDAPPPARPQTPVRQQSPVLAQAEPAASARPQEGAGANPSPPVPPQSAMRDPSSYSKSEVEILQSLSQRREELEAKARDLEFREQLLGATAKQVDEKIAALKEIERRIEDLLKKRDEEEERNLRSLVKVYENMKPVDAARIFEQLEMAILLDVVERMREAKVAPILAQMNPGKAKKVTEELAARRALPSRMPEERNREPSRQG
ncbi:MAG: hypothetical protein KIT20_08280 [Alphaproteobacteria bacterium]|nr:hypothetical protein [Alphaproteobacteria bacterium]